MKKASFRYSLLALLLGTLSMANFSCKDKDEETAQETITRVVLQFTKDGYDQEFEWSDTDGPGGNAPVVPVLNLPNGGPLHCRMYFYDGTTDITEEIQAESSAHLLVFASALSTLQITYNDADANGKPLGIETIWTPLGTSNGSVKITLYHEPSNKDDLSNPGGETDYEATFQAQIP